MVTTATLGMLAALALAQQTDTTFTVGPRQRLDVTDVVGEIVVRTWARNAVRIEADHSRRDRLVIDTESDRVGIRVRNRNRPAIVNYLITVPATMTLELGGPQADVRIEGAEGEVSVAVHEGDVSIIGGRGRVSVRSVEGDIWIEATEGRVRAVAIDGDIHVLRASGELVLETTDGDIVLDDMRAAGVEVTSVDGEISYSGIIQPGGLYVFDTHDGDITLAVPSSSSARVTVATYDGDFSSNIPLTVPRRTEGRRFSFTLGDGDAKIEIEAFDGDIRLVEFTPRTRR